MAKNTNKNLYKSTIYCVYVRNHSSSGTFDGVTKDLDRIKDLGVDTIWLMPIHPIGEYEKKGTLGCPYSIKDYRGVNPEYGNIDDFKNLVTECHNRGLKCIIDVVYNHTSKDSVLTRSNPEYFIKDENGNFYSKVEDWTDVADLDYSNMALWDELIDTLMYWCSIGVDGFRCDVAPLVPIDFWLKARNTIKSKYPDTIFLAETGGLDFIEYLRMRGFDAATDSEMFTAFDICYDYDIKDSYHNLLEMDDYLPYDFGTRLFIQNNIYPSNAVKLRFLENHDNSRAAKVYSGYYDLTNYTAMIFFQKGTPLVYAGQETLETHVPSLFEKDTISLDIKNQEFYDFLKVLISLKKENIFRDGYFYPYRAKDKYALHFCYLQGETTLNGLFNIANQDEITVGLNDGEYTNILNSKTVQVTDNKVQKSDLPAFIYAKPIEQKSVFLEAEENKESNN